MAYLAFAETCAGAADRVLTLPKADTVPARLSALEWSVVALARNDRLSSLREPGRISMAMGTLFGGFRNPRLADPQLEALRRIAVLSWHHGYTVPSREVKAFIAAGYTPDQYELVVDSVEADRLHREERLSA
ncbi:hypothetical protein KCP91_08980 [Microvirga sp. SRT01]|jgi:hypothetical protein|uniref:Antitoxin VbhA domain-containing protein n=1 Tax=Sphingomonas longa TaxID=2778730 RepID=A0ABS2D6G1_9SPHN|nr:MULTISPECIES: hypothetical protein [Alphaproteobacteria]MBM6576506.1 hypothetical protein [Sphingomonas sp. BT552]MBR7709552.1 hypothetical protein [Microvirga sp. SRT01]